MRYSKVLAFAILLAALTSVPRSAPAQVSINIGPEPACPYGYYDYLGFYLSWNRAGRTRGNSLSTFRYSKRISRKRRFDQVRLVIEADPVNLVKM